MPWKGWAEFRPKNTTNEIASDATPAKSKYKNRKVTVDGMTFDSKKEYKRWLELMAYQQAKVIEGLCRQVRYPLTVYRQTPTPTFKKIGAYVADFVYVRDGRHVVEDVKGYRTDMYRWKKKHFEAEYGLPIVEI